MPHNSLRRAIEKIIGELNEVPFDDPTYSQGQYTAGLFKRALAALGGPVPAPIQQPSELAQPVQEPDTESIQPAETSTSVGV